MGNKLDGIGSHHISGQAAVERAIAEILATAYLRLRQRAHKSRIHATLEPKTPSLLSGYRVPPE